MVRKAKTVNVEVTYKDAEPKRFTVETQRHNGEFSYNPQYQFKMDGATAVLASVTPDGDSYPVQSNSGTRKAAKESAQELPFVESVVMFE